MGRLISPDRREIAAIRLKFLFYEIIPIFVLIFIVQILLWTLLPFIVNQSSVLFEVSFYSIRALMIFCMILLFFFIYNRYKTEKIGHIKEDLELHKGYLRLYNMTQKNYIYQLLYSILLLFLILIPLEFLIAMIFPQIISYRAFSLFFKTPNLFLIRDNFIMFLILSCIIQFSISFSEETLFRGFIAKRGSEHFNKTSAVIISTLYFTFTDLFLNTAGFALSYYYGIIWFIKTFIIGVVLSLTIIRRKWLFPLIFAKTVDSILSSVIIWDFLIDGNFTQLFIIIYSPLMLISIIILILQRSRVKESLQIGIAMLKSYFRDELKIKESSGDKIFHIFFDIFLAFLIFLFGLLISI